MCFRPGQRLGLFHVESKGLCKMNFVAGGAGFIAANVALDGLARADR
jgi:hypothetical protein